MDCALTIISKIGEFLVEPAIKEVRCLFCFNNIVKDLKQEEEKLKSAQDRINQDVERANHNAEIIEKDVTKWIDDASNMLKEVHSFEEEIQANTTCLNGSCTNCGCRYWLARKATKKTSIMLKLIQDCGKFRRLSHPAPLPSIEFLTCQDFQLFKSSEPAFNEIFEALKNDQINIVGLYGMGGAGKTTLAIEVGKKVKKEMSNEVVFITISQTPNFRDVQDKLAASLDLKFETESEVERAKKLYVRFMNTKKILVILDDVWKAFDLQRKIGIPFNVDHKGCKVLLTMRREQVCIDMNCQQKIQLNVLNEEEGLALLKKHANVGNDCPALNDVAIDVAKECGGLPLALVAIGCALKGKGIKDWKRIFKKLKEAKLEDVNHDAISGEEGIYHCLKLSYDNLKDEKTKFCFLLCSLFPEDHNIPLVDLVRYVMGLGWYHSIEDAKTEVLSIVNSLKDSCLLLDDGKEDFIKMHDMFRDVALWIASKGKNVFMSRTGMTSAEWSNEESWEEYTAISCLSNKISKFLVGLICPKLEILVLEGEKYNHNLIVSDECFKEMKALKVVTLRYVDLSLKSFQFLINLKTLQLLYCNLRDLSSLSNLTKLKILSFCGSIFNELPRELSKLRQLRMLDLQYCHQLERIFLNVIRSFCHLEELYIGDSFGEWELEGTSAEKSNASLSELNSLSSLTVLVLRINSRCLPKGFHFACHQSLRYDISLNTSSSFYSSRSASNALSIKDIEATSLIAFKQLYRTLKYLCLRNIINCQNILPSIDQGGLNELISLRLESCQDLICLVNTSQEQVPAERLPRRFLENLETIYVHEAPNMFSLFPAMLLQRFHKLQSVDILYCNKLEEVFQLDELSNTREENLQLLTSLVKLRISNLPKLRCIWKGPAHHVNLQRLLDVEVSKCKSLTYLFMLSLAQSLIQLKSLKVVDCKSLEHLVTTEEGVNGMGEEIVSKSDHVTVVLPSLEKLFIRKLPKLRCIWKGPTHHVNLKSLTNVEVSCCKSLTYVFTLSLAQSLVLLKSLIVDNCESLEFLVTEEGDNDEGKEILSKPNHYTQCHDFFSKLESLQISSCKRLEYICPVSIAQGLVQLEELTIENVTQLKQVFYVGHGREENIAAREGKDNALIELHKLKKLRLDGLPNLIRFCPENYFSTWPNLEEFTIEQCSNLSTSFISEVIAKVKDLQEKLRILSFDSCSHLYDTVLSQLRYGFLRNLKELSIKKYRIKMIFELEALVADEQQQTLSLSNLETLRLEFLKELEGLWKGPMHLLSLENLTTLDISHCNRLKHIFSPTLALNLLQLELLIIKDCKELQQIIFEDDEEDQILLKDHLEPLFFPKLFKIYVRRCHKLKYLFPITIAQGLQKLAIIDVMESLQLQQVFGHKDVADIMNHKEIFLSQLKVLDLINLPNLTNICHVGYHFKFLSLSRLIVKKCAKMTTRFSYDAQDESVYAEAKVLNIGNEDEIAESLSEPTMYIICRRRNELREKLPPYMENEEQRITQLHS